MSTEAWTIIVSICLALVGYLVTFLMQRNQERRQAQLERVNLQLRNLYGPLYSTLLANQAIWDAFRNRLWPQHGRSSYFYENETTELENARWRTWMIHVFEPLNARIEKVILENGDLLEGSQLPEDFVQALAHIASYRALYPNWEVEDFSEHVGLINYPDGLFRVIEPTYHRLLERQRQLSGRR